MDESQRKKEFGKLATEAKRISEEMSWSNGRAFRMLLRNFVEEQKALDIEDNGQVKLF